MKGVLFMQQIIACKRCMERWKEKQTLQFTRKELNLNYGCFMPFIFINKAF